MDRIINVKLISSPINWAIVFLMIALAGSLLALIIPDSDND
jgi:hypothetical protein